MPFSFSIPKPIDAHVHLRDGEILKKVAPLTARQFSYAVVMPNLNPPITTSKQALGYKKTITAAAKNKNFTPLVTLYMTDNTKKSEIRIAKEEGIIGIKLYPANATTNSESGVTNIRKVYPVLEEMQKYSLPLLIHGEVTDSDVDVFDREAAFIERYLKDITKNFPSLRIVLEHLTTKQAVDFVKSADNVFATITAHHLLFNRNEIFRGGIRPHYYCLPVLKREEHRKALVKAATSGNKKFFAGTDSAPHLKNKKESSCGCAGCFTANHAVELYVSVFDKKEFPVKAFTDFMYTNALNFYELAPVKSRITLKKVKQKTPSIISGIVPLLANEEIGWKVSI